MDSAISCSTHSPKLAIGSETMNVSLSRPWSASSAIARPIHRPELEDVESKWLQFCSASCEDSSSARTSTPATAAGTRPKYDSTE